MTKGLKEVVKAKVRYHCDSPLSFVLHVAFCVLSITKKATEVPIPTDRDHDGASSIRRQICGAIPKECDSEVCENSVEVTNCHQTLLERIYPP